MRIYVQATIVALAVGSAFAEEAAKTPPHLVYILADPAGPQADALAQCDKLTIEKYRSVGTKVTEKSHADLAKWLEADGKEHAKKHPRFQLLAYTRSLRADAIGGLNSLELSLEEGSAPKNVFEGWGIALGGCGAGGGSLNFDEGNSVRAIPLHLAGKESDPWSIALRVHPRPCSAADAAIRMEMPSGRGRPFLGIGLDGATIKEVVPDSPALAAGIKAGDTLSKFNGKQITDLEALRDAMKDRKPGDEIEVEYVHDGTPTTKRITLADYHDVVEVKQEREGKPLPSLVGKDIDGREVKLADLKGKVVLLDFWATWCGPCKEEMPLLQLLYEQTKGKDFVWVSVSVDDDEETWRTYVRNNKLGGIQLRSPEWAGEMFVSGFPTVLLVDRAGVMQCELRGERTAQAVMSMLGAK